jgi:hypothetical protein
MGWGIAIGSATMALSASLAGIHVVPVLTSD